jgi:hypothetical protein
MVLSGLIRSILGYREFNFVRTSDEQHPEVRVRIRALALHNLPAQNIDGATDRLGGRVEWLYLNELLSELERTRLKIDIAA